MVLNENLLGRYKGQKLFNELTMVLVRVSRSCVANRSHCIGFIHFGNLLRFLNLNELMDSSRKALLSSARF